MIEPMVERKDRDQHDLYQLTRQLDPDGQDPTATSGNDHNELDVVENAIGNGVEDQKKLKNLTVFISR